MRRILLRYDQISFIEKNKFGVSRIYALVEFKGISGKRSFQNDYLTGTYRAVPFVNQMHWAFSDVKMLENA